MDHVSFQGVDLAELLPRIPDSIKNGLPFGLVKLDLTGKILEYNMTEGALTGVDPAWALGRNFFDEVALCTKTAAFYGRFVEGVRKGFLNAVFDYTFDHRQDATRVRVHMVTVPDHLGRMNVMILVKRSDRPVVTDAISMVGGPSIYQAAAAPVHTSLARQAPAAAVPGVLTKSMPAAQVAMPLAAQPAAGAVPSIEDIVRAVVAVMNQVGYGAASPVAAPVVAPAAPVAAARPVPAVPPAPVGGSSRHEDIIKF